MTGDKALEPGKHATEGAPSQAAGSALADKAASALTAKQTVDVREKGLLVANGSGDVAHIANPGPESARVAENVRQSGTVSANASIGLSDQPPGHATASTQLRAARSASPGPMKEPGALQQDPASLTGNDVQECGRSDAFPGAQPRSAPRSALPDTRAPTPATAGDAMKPPMAVGVTGWSGSRPPAAVARDTARNKQLSAATAGPVDRNRSRNNSAPGNDDNGDGGGTAAYSSDSDNPLDAGCKDDSSDEDYDGDGDGDDDDEDYNVGRRQAVRRGGAAVTMMAAPVKAGPERKKPKWAQPLVRPENDRVRSLRSSQPPPGPKPPPPPPANRGKSKSKSSHRSGDNKSKPKLKGPSNGDGEGSSPGVDVNAEEGAEGLGRSRSRGPSTTYDGDEEGDGGGSRIGSGYDSDSDSESESGSGPESDADDPASMVREVAEDAVRTATTEVMAMWEFAAVLEFLTTFRGVLCGHGPDSATGSDASSAAAAAVLSSILSEGSWSGDLLADELVRCVGAPGSLLGRLHLGLLQGVARRSARLDEATWPAVLNHRIATEYRRLHPGRHPRDYYKPTPPLPSPPPPSPQQQGQVQGQGAEQQQGMAAKMDPEAGGSGKSSGFAVRPKRAVAVGGNGSGDASGSGPTAGAAAEKGSSGSAAAGQGGGGGGGSGGRGSSGSVDPMLPFWSEKGHEWRVYAALHPRDRVLALKLLCDLRLECEDLKRAIDALLVPPRPGSAAAAAAAAASKGGRGGGRGGGGRRRGADGTLPPAALTVDDVRKRPLGRDSSGAAMWVVGRLPDLQMRLYREHPPSWPKPKKPRAASPPPEETKGGRGKGPGKGKAATAADGGGGGGTARKKKGQKAPPPYLLYELPPEAVAGRWELLGIGAEGLGGAAEEMRRRSKKQQDRELADKISTELVSVLVDEAERRERKHKLEAKLRFTLGSDFYETRSRRTRKEVNYSTAAYDKMFHEALRGDRLPATTSNVGSNKRSRGGPSSEAAEEGRDLIEEEMQGEGEEGGARGTAQWRAVKRQARESSVEGSVEAEEGGDGGGTEQEEEEQELGADEGNGGEEVQQGEDCNDAGELRVEKDGEQAQGEGDSAGSWECKGDGPVDGPAGVEQASQDADQMDEH